MTNIRKILIKYILPPGMTGTMGKYLVKLYWEFYF